MTGGDAAWYRMDRPRNETDVLAALSFAGPLTLDRLQRVVEERLLALEPFRDRAVPRWAGRPGWEPDPGFSLRRHLSHVRIPGGGLPELLAEVTSSTLDPAHPLWRLVLAEEPDGETTLVAKVHHALGDGFALVALLIALGDERVADAPPRPRVVGPEHRPRTPWLPGVDLVAAARDAASFAVTLARLTALPRDPPWLAGAPLSGVRRVAATRAVPLDAIADAAHRAGGTVNDVVVAAVAGALRAHLTALGVPVDRALRAFLPVNFRDDRPDLTVDPTLGNRFGLLAADLPVNLPTPAARLDAVRRTIAALRTRDDARVSHDVLAACGAAPNLLHHAVTGFFARKCSLVLTNLAGPATPLRIAGRRLSSVAFWVPHTATLGLGVSVMSYAGEVRIGVRSDVAALAAPAALATAIEAELAALGVRAPAEAAGRGPAPGEPAAVALH